MNILQPEIVIIGKRRYRRNPYKPSFQDSAELAPYQEEDAYNDEPCDTVVCKQKSIEPDEYKDIQPFGDNMFKLNMAVHESYLGYIIGRNAEKKTKLEVETKTKIKIPKRGQGDWLVIEGNSKANIDSCRNRILVLIHSARHQKPFTHLLTYPLTFTNLKTKFLEFKREVLKQCQDDRGVDDSLFQNPNKLHLTISTAVLLCESEIDQAKALLETFKKTYVRQVLNGKPLRVSIKGLEYMNDDPSSVDVLYAQIKPLDLKSSNENPVQMIADNLMEKFVSSGLSKKQYDRVKLHATVMNSLMRQDPSGSTEPGREQSKDRESFDARNILKLFGDYEFGIYDLNEIHLSLRFSAAHDGYYECVSKIYFNDLYE